MPPIEIQVHQHQIRRCHQFATKIIQGNHQYNRFQKDEDTQITRTYVGKLAELLFYNYLKSEGIAVEEGDMFAIYSGAENADNSDFILPNGQTIDIKTASMSYHRRIMVPTTQMHLKKDYYVGVKLDFAIVQGNSKAIDAKSISRAYIMGYTNRKTLEDRPVENFGEGDCKAVLLSDLVPIETLVRKFKE